MNFNHIAQNKMNYSEIILRGVFDKNTRNYLEKYFLREYKKAEKEQFFEADEFFRDCLNIIEGWEKDFEKEAFNYLRELIFTVDAINAGTISVNAMEGKTIEQSRQDLIEYYESEIKNVTDNGIKGAGGAQITKTLYLPAETGRISYNLTYSELLQIKHSITIAFQNTQTNIEPPPPRLQTNLTNNQRGQLFIELVKGGFIPNENLNCFKWAIKAISEDDTKAPEKWMPIEWKKAKQLLRELLEAIKSDEIIKAEMERITPALFSYKGKSLKLAKNKVKPGDPNHKKLMRNLEDIKNFSDHSK